MYDTSVTEVISASQVSSRTPHVRAGINLTGFFIGDRTMKRIPLTQGKFALIDDEDFNLVSQYKWCASKNGHTCYAYTTIQKPSGKHTSLTMHRLLLKPADGLRADHKDGDGLNNQRYNLRPCTHRENLRNQRAQKGGSSQYKGVYWHKRDNKWRAQIQINGKVQSLGNYIDEKEAAKAYNKVAVKYFGDFARINILAKVK